MAAKPKGPKTSPAEHLARATAKWGTFKSAMTEHATRSIAAREAWAREKEHRTATWHAEHDPPKGN